MTGRPSIASNRPSKSPAGAAAARRARARRSSVVGRGSPPTIFCVAVVAEEHVLGAAQADALGAELARALRVLGRVGVGADAEVRAARRPTRGRCRMRRSTSGSTSGTSSIVIVAARAVDRDPVARCRRVVSPIADLAGCRGRSRSPGAGHRRPPMPRATSAAWLGLAALASEDALAAWKPATSSASVNGRTRMTSRPSSPRATASSAREDDRALGRARRRRDAARQDLEVGSGVEGRVQERVEDLGVDRQQRLLAA